MSDDALAKTATAPDSATLEDGVAARRAAEPARIGRYTIERELGAGGMGIVYAAFDPELERRVALEVLSRANTADARQRFLREARALAKLHHPNVVTVYEIGTVDGRDYIAMQLVEGITLAEWLREKRRFLREIAQAFVAAGRGLAAAHAEGIVHRDFKPHNVLRRARDGQIVVTDFGLARAAGQVDDGAPAPSGDVADLATLTATGAWVGTPAYMAPEQWSGREIAPATDQFAFCVALWEALADQRPFQGDSVDEPRAAVSRKMTKVELARAPAKFRALLARGLDPDPARRWPNMDALVAELERLVRAHARGPLAARTRSRRRAPHDHGRGR